jgi:hypothetical protein
MIPTNDYNVNEENGGVEGNYIQPANIYESADPVKIRVT